jgi:hypothetical protein
MLDFQGLQLNHSEIPLLNISNRNIANLTIRNSIIGLLSLENSPVTEKSGLIIEGSILSVASGVSDKAGLPVWIKDTEVIEFDRLSNAARIKESPLSAQQRLFLAIVHKIFFQPGAGREEASLLKGGYGQKYSPKLVDAILRLLLREKMVERFKGDDGWVYKPIRKHAERLSRIRSELTLSDDPLWIDITSLRE